MHHHAQACGTRNGLGQAPGSRPWMQSSWEPFNFGRCPVRARDVHRVPLRVEQRTTRRDERCRPRCFHSTKRDLQLG